METEQRQLLSHSLKEKDTWIIGSYRDTGLLSIPGKVYCKTPTKRSKIAKDKISDEQGKYKTGNGYEDKSFNVIVIIQKKNLSKGVEKRCYIQESGIKL